MAYYLIAFLLSLIFTVNASRMFKYKRKKRAVLLSAIAILVPCILAGIRADSVGTDVLWYAIPDFKTACAADSFLEYYNNSNLEFMYSISVYAISRLTNDVSGLLFFSQLLIIIPIYILSYKYRNRYPMWLTMCLYFFLFYNLSLNIMRQSIACAIMLIAYSYIEENKFKGYLLFSIISIIFHTSAVIPFLLFIILDFVVKSKFSFIFKLLIVVATLFIFPNINNVIECLVYVGILPEKYYNTYLLKMEENDISLFEYAYRISFVIIPILILKMNKYKDQILHNYCYIEIIGLIISFLGSHYLTRVSYYFQYFFIFTLQIPLIYSSKRITKILSSFLIIIWVFLYWFIVYIYWNWHGTNPLYFRI